MEGKLASPAPPSTPKPTSEAPVLNALYWLTIGAMLVTIGWIEALAPTSCGRGDLYEYPAPLTVRQGGADARL